MLRLSFGLWCLIATLLFTQSALADDSPSKRDPQRSIGFSKIVVRTTEDRIHVIGGDHVRVEIAEYLRKQGLNALGGESLVFDRDDSNRAELVLGGTVFTAECKQSLLFHCVVGFEWEVLDVGLDEV